MSSALLYSTVLHSPPTKRVCRSSLIRARRAGRVASRRALSSRRGATPQRIKLFGCSCCSRRAATASNKVRVLHIPHCAILSAIEISSGSYCTALQRRSSSSNALLRTICNIIARPPARKCRASGLMQFPYRRPNRVYMYSTVLYNRYCTVQYVYTERQNFWCPFTDFCNVL